MNSKVEGSVRVRPEDFIVEEVGDFTPTGQGEHLALWVEKRGLDHRGMVRRIAGHFGTSPTQVGWAGMKDRGAVTRQWLTVRLPEFEGKSLIADDLRILDCRRTSRKIRPGHLRGNHFIIRIRDVDPARAGEIRSEIEAVAQHGLPNRFMEQRFGHRGINPVLGGLLLRQQWDALLDHWLGLEGPDWPRGEQRRREAFTAGDFREAAEHWPRHWATERAALTNLGIGATPQEVVAEVPKSIRRIWTDAVQASVFNHVVRGRIEQGTLRACLDDDILWHHDRFLESVGSPGELCVPTGPLWGRDMARARGDVDALETSAVAACGLDLGDLLTGTSAPGGGRRPLVAPVVRMSFDTGSDQHGPWVEVCFTLPRGAYATAVLDEIITRVAP